MRNTFVIAVRELEEKRLIVVAALAFSLLPFVLAVVPGISHEPARNVIGPAGLIMATGFTIGLGLIMGATFIGRDLADGRMSFYFSRPAGTLSIWFGKLIASVLLIVGCFALILAPSWVAAGRGKSGFVLTMREETLIVLGSALALFLIAHVIGTFVRSRSQLIAFDFAAVVVCGVAIRYLLVALAAGQAFILMKWLGISLAVALLVAIIGGGAWQLERGRTDRRRNHLALSQFLWGTMAAALLIAGGYVAWVTSVRMSDLSSELQAAHSATGPFAVIGGKTKGRGDYQAAFLVNDEDHSVTRVDSRAIWSTQFTRDGRSAVIPRLEGNFAELLLYRRGVANPIDTGLSTTASGFFVSDDGGRIATISYPRLFSVYDVATKRSLVTVRLPESRYDRIVFLSPDLVRIYLQTAGELKIMELDVRTRRLEQTGTIASTAFVSVFADPTAARILVRPARTDQLTLNDARSGTVIAPISSDQPVSAARFLHDGRMAVAYGPPASSHLNILSAAGVVEREIPLEASDWTTIIGDDGQRVVVMTTDRAAGFRTFLAVNIERGVIERRERIRDWIPSGWLDPRPSLAPLREVFYRDGNRIIAWSPSTGAKRVITGT